MTTTIEPRVFFPGERRAALGFARKHDIDFFEYEGGGTMGPSPSNFVVVAPTEHQAKLALVSYLNPLRKLTKREVEAAYIEELEKAAQAVEKHLNSEPEGKTTAEPTAE